MKTKLLAVLVFLIPVLIYVWQNSWPQSALVPVHFIRWEYTVSQALLVFSTLLVGVLLGLMLSSAWRNKEKNQQKKAEKKVKKLKKTEEKLKKQQEKQQKSEEQKTVEPQHEESKESPD